MNKKDPNAIEGMRVRAGKMPDDPNPIPSGTMGTIYFIDHAGIIHVDWDNGRRLGLIPGVDEYELLEPDFGDVFDKINENDKGTIKAAVAKGSAEIKSMPKPKKTPSNIKNFSKKLGIKTDKVKNIKVESEKKIDEMTGVGGAVGASTTPTSVTSVNPSGGTTPPITGTGKKTWGKGPLSKTKGVAKPGPLHSTKKKNKKVKENIFTKNELVKEITDMRDTGIDDTNKEAWADKNSDGWRWNDTPIFEEGEIVDPLAKMKIAWDDDNLDISKDWDKIQKIKKEDLLRMVNNRINESKKKKEPVEEEQIEEETTFGSVFPGGNFPVIPTFAAKKGHWRTAKNPIWKGGKIVQQVENSGILNPVNEANTVKYNKGGKFVKIKKKCTKFPYCSQGAIDNPLNISDKVTEPGTYVEEQLMKNIHEVALETGKSFQEVYNIVKKSL